MTLRIVANWQPNRHQGDHDEPAIGYDATRKCGGHWCSLDTLSDRGGPPRLARGARGFYAALVRNHALWVVVSGWRVCWIDHYVRDVARAGILVVAAIRRFHHGGRRISVRTTRARNSHAVSCAHYLPYPGRHRDNMFALDHWRELSGRWD